MKTRHWLGVVLFAVVCGCVAEGPEPEALKEPALKSLPAEVQPVVWEESETDKKGIFYVKLETTKGDVVVEVHPGWSPRGAAQFRAAVLDGVYDEARFFRVLREPDNKFMAQFGIPGSPPKSTKWKNMRLNDESPRMSNLRGMVTYAMGGPNSRTTQLFINYKDNSFLDEHGFAPIARVVQGMEFVDALYAEYGEGPPEGTGPNQMRIEQEGNAYLEASYPKLDFIKKASILEGPPSGLVSEEKPAAEPASAPRIDPPPAAESKPELPAQPAAEISAENKPAEVKPATNEAQEPAANPPMQPESTPNGN